MFTEALFTIARTQKQPRCPSAWWMDEDLVHIHNGISLSHKKNDFQSVFSEVDEPRAVIQSEVRQKEKKKYCVQFSRSVVSDSLRPHGLQHARPLCPSPTPGVYSNSCPLSLWCHPAISSSVVPFSSHLQSSPASGSFPMSQFFSSGGQSFGVSASASVLPMNIQDWFPLGWTGWISLQSKGLSRVFNSTVQKQESRTTVLMNLFVGNE